MDAFGASRMKPRPPERGVFPLDHDGECKPFMRSFLKCMKENNSDHFHCKDLSKEYLQCRMSHGLMAEEDLNSLGLGETREYTRKDPQTEEEQRTEARIAGLNVRGSNKWGLDFFRNRKDH